MYGAATTPIKVTTNNTTPIRAATWSTKSRVSSNERVFLYSERIGTNANEKAPSANKRRKRLGIRNATKKASVAMPAPKIRAINISLTNPRIRDTKVMLLTAAKDLSKFMRVYINLIS